MLTLKRTCRTCIHLEPATYETWDYDSFSPKGYSEDKYPCNCEFVQYDENVDAPADRCGYYEQINIETIIEE